MRYCGWKCLWCSSLISHPCSSEIHRGGCNGGSNTMALRCYLCPSLCWSDCRWDLEHGEEKRAVGAWLQCNPLLFIIIFFPLGGAGWQADGLVTIKTKKSAEKFARVNSLSPRWDVEGTPTGLHAYRRHTHAETVPAGFKHTICMGRVCRRSVKCVLGLKNVFPVFVAIAYVALECKVLQNTSCISRQ